MPADADDFETRLRDAKLAAMAEFCAGAGHEINNPAAAIVGRCALLAREYDDPALRRELRTIAGQALRIRDMIADARLFADPPAPEPEPVDLAEVAADALCGLAERADDAGCVLRTDCRPAPLHADPTQLAVLTAALVANGIEAGASRVRVRTGIRGRRAVLWVSDDGPGFDEQARRHAFDPFWSGRQAGRGSGFGLPKAWRVVTLHGGTLAVRSRPGATCFRAALPAAA